jgi:hypothetical protein
MPLKKIRLRKQQAKKFINSILSTEKEENQMFCKNTWFSSSIGFGFFESHRDKQKDAYALGDRIISSFNFLAISSNIIFTVL